MRSLKTKDLLLAWGLQYYGSHGQTPTKDPRNTNKYQRKGKKENFHFARVRVLLGARSVKRLGFVIVPAYPLPVGCARDGLVPLGLSSADLPVPHQGTTCAWTSMGQVGASDLGHWQAFGFRPAVGSAGTRRV